MFYLTEPSKKGYKRDFPSISTAQSKTRETRCTVPSDILTRQFSNMHFLNGNLKLNTGIESGLSDIKTCYMPDFGTDFERIDYSDEEIHPPRQYSRPWDILTNSILTNYAPKHSSLLNYIQRSSKELEQMK